MSPTEYRKHFPIFSSRSYLFWGALAPAATEVRAQWDSWAEAWSTDPNSVITGDMKLGGMSLARQAFARLIGAEAREIALTDNTSRAANLAIRILEAKGNGYVIVDDTTYPSSVYPWRARGWDVRYVPTADAPDPAGAIADAIDDGCLAVCVSHVAPFSGLRHDLTALARAAHAHGAFLMVDAAQSAGVVPVDVHASEVDLLFTTGMKWLLGPPGIAFLYVSSELLADAPVLDVGYIGLDVASGDWPVTSLPPISREAKRYELGLPSLPALYSAAAGIEILREAGVEPISRQVEHLVTQCIDGLSEHGQESLTPRNPTLRAGVVVFRHKAASSLFDHCRSQRVDIGTVGSDLVRVDFHGFNNEDDLRRFLECFKSFTEAS
jgi:selenocysteine lyase/cysteine desulfurase